jgi:hypothetical protein
MRTDVVAERTMKRNIIMIVGAVLAFGCTSDRFTLHDPASGKQYGPFAVRTGTAVTIDGKTYVVKRAITGSQETEDVLKSVVMPELCFLGSNVHDAFGFLRSAEVEYRPVEDMDRAPIDIRLLVPDDWKPRDLGTSLAWCVNISLYDALDIIAKRYGLKMVLKERAVWLIHKDWTAQQDESTIPSKAAPSASSDVR